MKYETMDYLKMLKRMIRAGGKRVGQADEIELAEIVELHRYMEEVIKDAISNQLEEGKSWQNIGDALNVSRQAAFKKWKA